MYVHTKKLNVYLEIKQNTTNDDIILLLLNFS